MARPEAVPAELWLFPKKNAPACAGQAGSVTSSSTCAMHCS